MDGPIEKFKEINADRDIIKVKDDQHGTSAINFKYSAKKKD
jgi:hypothetical protein